MRPCLLLTRPQAQSALFAQQARADGWAGDVLISPVLRIVLQPPETTRLDTVGTLVFTSQHAVAALVATTMRRDWPVWAVGPRTAQAAQEAGFRDVLVSGGDATALLRDLTRDPPKPPVLHLRGQHAASDIARHLRAAGQNADAVVVYRQEPCALSPEATARLSQGGDAVLAVFSPRSARLLAAALHAQASISARLHMIAISDAAAKPLKDIATGRCRIATRPDAAAMRAALLAMQATLEPWGKPR